MVISIKSEEKTLNCCFSSPPRKYIHSLSGNKGKEAEVSGILFLIISKIPSDKKSALEEKILKYPETANLAH